MNRQSADDRIFENACHKFFLLLDVLPLCCPLFFVYLSTDRLRASDTFIMLALHLPLRRLTRPDIYASGYLS